MVEAIWWAAWRVGCSGERRGKVAAASGGGEEAVSRRNGGVLDLVTQHRFHDGHESTSYVPMALPARVFYLECTMLSQFSNIFATLHSGYKVESI
jgi:hypothetical protein